MPEIQLEEPYKSVYRKGYLVTNPENRKNIILVNHSGKLTTTSYARYLMSVHLGVFIAPGIEVDHINDDKTDDRIENLQLLTQRENIAKSNKLRKKAYKVTCFVCKKDFILNGQKYGMYKDKTTITCSRRCGGIKGALTKAKLA